MRRLLIGLAVLGVLAVFAWKPAARAWWLRASEARFRAGDPAGAVAELETAAAWLPRDVEIALQTARGLRKLGRPQDALARLELARRLGADRGRLNREELLLLAASGRLSESEPALPRLLSDLTYDARDVTEAYAEGYRIHQRFDEAAALLEAWREDYPEDPRPHLQLGVMRQMVTDWPRAAQEYRAALERGASWPLTRLRLGQCLLENNEVEAAEAELRRFVGESPLSIEGRLAWAQALEQLGRSDEALRELTACLDRSPRSYEAEVGVARLDLAAGRVREAADRLQRLLDDWPEDAETLHLYGQALRRQGDHAAADAVLPRWEQADKAVEHVQQMITEAGSRPDDASLRREIGLLLLKHYSRSMGEQYLLNVLQRNPEDAAAREALSGYYEWQGATEAARALRSPTRDAGAPGAGYSGADAPARP